MQSSSSVVAWFIKLRRASGEGLSTWAGLRNHDEASPAWLTNLWSPIRLPHCPGICSGYSELKLPIGVDGSTRIQGLEYTHDEDPEE